MKKKTILFIILGILGVISILSYSYIKNSKALSSDKYLLMYQMMIDSLMDSSNNLSTDAEYLALDLDSFELLNSNDKRSLIDYAKKYHTNVFASSYEELKEKGLIDESGINLKGYLISINEFKRILNTVTLEIGRYKESLGAFGYCYKAKYKNNKWNIKEKCLFVS